MGLFRYDNPFIVMMVRIANMMIVSFFWVLCCLPVVTILPACAALYYTVNKVIFGSDLCEIGLADRIEQMFIEELAGPGAVRATLQKYLG